MVDLVKMSHLMEEAGFKNVSMQSEHAGIPFDLKGEGRIGIQKMQILVKNVKTLTEEDIPKIVEEYMALNDKTKSHLVGKIFIYCLLADSAPGDVASILVQKIEKSESSLGSLIKGGGGALIFVEYSSNTIYPKRSTKWGGMSEGKLRKILLALADHQTQ